MTAQSTENKQEEKKSFFSKDVAIKLAGQLRDGEAPMQRQEVQNIPYNPATGRSFHGINALNLMMQDRKDDRWMTFEDARNAGYKVKSGEKGTPVQKWARKQPGEDKQKMQTTWLFNAEQLQFIPPMQKKPERPDPYERVTEILNNCGATVVHDQKKEAFYDPAKDTIHLPQPDSYKNINNYCQDALNAYFHSTGHPSRQDRDSFDSPKRYQQNAEELICSVSTMMMCAEIGIPCDSTKNPELAKPWADNIEKFPVQFSQGMKAADDAVWRTLRQEQMRNIELNPENNQVWRPVAEASPAVAVKTFLAQQEVLTLADNEPEKVNTFQHDGKEIFNKPGTGNVLSKIEQDAPDMNGTLVTMKGRTEGYDREGNTYDIVVLATALKNSSGLMEWVAPPTAIEINLSTREMALPLDWNGKVTVGPCHEDEKGTIVPGRSDDFPEFHGAFAECGGNDVLLASFDREKQAEHYASLVERQLQYQQERPQNQQHQAGKEQEASTEQQNSQGNEARQEERPQSREQTEEREESPEEREYREQTEQDREESPEKSESVQNPEQLRQEAKEKIAERLTEEKQDADKAAKRVAAMAKRFDVPKEPTPYMQAKGVDLIPGAYQNKASTCIPLYNADGELRSMAYADKDGKKNYAKGTDRNGCAFYDKKAVEESNVVGFAVGVATAATVSQVIKGVPVVATMDSANLPVVVAAFKEKYPEKQQIIFADKRILNENDSGKNPVSYQAFKAAQKHGAVIVSPRFGANENGKGFTDFNDLANKSKLGKEAVKEQCESALEKAKQMAAEKAREQKTEKERSNKELARG